MAKARISLDVLYDLWEERERLRARINDLLAAANERARAGVVADEMQRVSAENDRLRARYYEIGQERERIYAAIRAAREAALRVIWGGYVPAEFDALFALLPPEHRDRGDEADCVRDEP